MCRLFVTLWFVMCAAPQMSKCLEGRPLLQTLLQVSHRNNCTTAKGKSGLCTKRTLCEDFSEPATYGINSTCPQNTITEMFVCCPLSQIENQNDHRKQKRDTDTSAPPNLRIKGCGIRRSLVDFVVGGQESNYWPWMAAILVRSPGSNTDRFTCGGTVISRRFVITAAHCLVQRDRATPASWITIRVGSLDYNEGSAFPVNRVIIHEDYNRVLQYDDIALLRTSADMEVKNVVPACLPSPGMFNANFYQRQATVVGWGDDRFGGTSSTLLRDAVVPVINNKVCSRRYKRLGTFSLSRGIADTQICAGADDGSKDACQGDSGGPLMLKDKGGKWTVVGIVSFGYECGHPDYPGVYTRVAKYLYWLRDKTDIPDRNST